MTSFPEMQPTKGEQAEGERVVSEEIEGEWELSEQVESKKAESK